MLWSRHILVSFVMATRWPPVDCALPELSIKETEVHKTLNYFTMAY
ncbi:unnamed protein product [Callosobruchus maculatus]|uniref:Uncharacterized protein n=1 Tax=Callosobruchus maculatus TaxID=64391 RepID=A0A653CUI1_CALMS|nr:unnamed protein product [Callosobruchus maculatus]